MKAQTDDNWKSSIGQPVRGSYTEYVLKPSGTAAYLGILENIDPGQGNGPGRNNIRDGSQIGYALFPRQVGTDNKPCQNTPDKHGEGGKPESNKDCVP